MGVIVRRKVTLAGVLGLVLDMGDILLPAGSRLEAWRRSKGLRLIDWEKHFPSEVERVVGRLARNGWVEKRETSEGTRVIITDKGKRQVLLFQLEDLQPKKGRWDGKWRIGFFDVEEEKRKKRADLRRYLKKLGSWQMQKSVWVCPYDCEKEIKYLREVLGIPHEVKLGLLERLENERELKDIFDL